MKFRSAGILLGLFLTVSLTFCANAQKATRDQPSPPAVEDPAHDQLRKLRADVEAVVNQQAWEQLTELLTENVVVTWLDGTQSHGRQEVLDYLNAKTGGDDPLVERFALSVQVSDLSDLHGDDTAVAFGTATSAFVLRGQSLDVTGPWSATVVRDGDSWKIASAHASLGAFDNPLLTWAWRMFWIAGAVAGVAGLAVGIWIGRRRSRTG